MVQETNNNKNTTSPIFKILILSFLFLVFGVIITFSILSIRSPLEKIKVLNTKFKDESISENLLETLSNEDFYRLKKEEAFLKARLLMSENDSINLSIDIPDSIINIEIKGTNIYTVRIKKIQVCKVFDHIDRDALINYLSSPFCILHEKTTILKEPLIVKKAPKDTIEANKNITQPDTIGPKIVEYSFYTDKDLLINIKQVEDLDVISSFKYKFDYNLQISNLQLKKLVELKIPDYIPWIQLEVDKNEAIALFRALPEHAFISIHL
jgi:hypothetical protein